MTDTVQPPEPPVEDLIGYEGLLAEAYKTVCVAALTFVAEHPHVCVEQPLYLTFVTKYPGVEMPEGLLAVYPEVITLCLQHQFKAVTDERGITLGLAFKGVPRTLFFPWDSLLTYQDRGVGASFGFAVAVPNPDPMQDVVLDSSGTDTGRTQTAVPNESNTPKTEDNVVRPTFGAKKSNA